MSEETKHRALIIGAGSMGIITGYILSLAGVAVTFLIRPHRAKALTKAQILFCYNDNQLKVYKDYTYITDPSAIVDTEYDYIVITLDAASLRNEVGQHLIRTIGKAVQGSKTGVILGSIFIELRPWFLQISGLSGEQVTNGILYIQAYPTEAVTLPIHPPTDQTLVAQADLAYADSLGPGFVVDDSSKTVANGFAKLYNNSGISSCNVIPTFEHRMSSTLLFPVFAACALMDWPKFQDIDSKSELWSLTITTIKEIRTLGIYGEQGQRAAEEINEKGLAALLVGMENQLLPLDLQAFNRYHHGVKVNLQDRELLRTCLLYSEAEGKEMPALRKLLSIAHRD